VQRRFSMHLLERTLRKEVIEKDTVALRAAPSVTAGQSDCQTCRAAGYLDSGIGGRRNPVRRRGVLPSFLSKGAIWRRARVAEIASSKNSQTCPLVQSVSTRAQLADAGSGRLRERPSHAGGNNPDLPVFRLSNRRAYTSSRPRINDRNSAIFA
jgi:hypothetical protein